MQHGVGTSHIEEVAVPQASLSWGLDKPMGEVEDRTLV